MIVTTVGWGTTGISWVEAEAAAACPTVQTSLPTRRNDLVQNVISARVEESRLKE